MKKIRKKTILKASAATALICAILVFITTSETLLFAANTTTTDTTTTETTTQTTDGTTQTTDGTKTKKEPPLFLIENGVLKGYNIQLGGKNVVIPEGVTRISKDAFINNYWEEDEEWYKNDDKAVTITSISIPASVTTIDLKAFDCIRGLKTITVNSKNTKYSSYKNALYDKKQKTLIKYPCGRSSVKLSSKTKTIASYAFAYNYKIKKISIPKSVTEIKSNAFLNCESLHKITIPESTKKISKNAFRGCSYGYVKERITSTYTNTVNTRLCLNLVVKSGSYAEEFAKKNKIYYIAQ